MRYIVGMSLRFRWLVAFAALAVMVFGIAELPQTKVDVFPEFAPPQVEIQTIALGNSSNEVEELITVPLEEQLSGIQGLTDMRSKSVAQLSSIRLIFGQDTDELRARQLVAERLGQVTATLPTWASPPFMMPALSSTSRIMKIGLNSSVVNQIDLSTIAYWKIRARLLRVPGVAQVAIWGEQLPQRHVQVDPAKLAEHDVSLAEVMDAAADAVEAGLLKYSEGAVVGTGVSSRRRPTLQYPPCAADHGTRRTRGGAGGRARREGSATRGHGRCRHRPRPPDRRRGHQ